MRIALIDPSLFTWPYDSALAEGLRALGHEVVIYGKHLAPAERGNHSELLHETFYPGFYRRWMQSLPRPVFLLLKGLAHPLSLTVLLRRLRQFKPDVIHFQWAPLPVLDQYFISKFRAIAPTVLTIHDSNPFNNNPGSSLQRLAAISIMHRFDRLIVHTDQAKQRLKKRGIASARVAQIPHGILEQGLDAFAGGKPTIRADQRVGVLLFGKLKPYKGADILLRAISIMPPLSRARCHLRIVGKSYMEVMPLRELAQQLGIEDNVTWDLRFIDDVEIPHIFASADIIAMPYREIDASGVLMMALAAGHPIIASRIGLFAEMLQDGVHGYLIEPEDHVALSEALTKLVDDESRRRRMGQEVIALKDSIPDWISIAEMTEDLYRHAANGR